MSYKPSKCPDCKSDVQMCCCQAWDKNSLNLQDRINKTFNEWYEDYEGNGEELLQFNTIDLQSAFK